MASNHRILIATEKAFARDAVDKMLAVLKGANYEFILLENYKEKESLYAAAEKADAIIIRSDKVDEPLLERAKGMKLVIRAGAGYDNVDLPACTKRGIVVMNTPGQNSNAVAELAFGLMLYSARCNFTGKSGSELRGKRLGLHAYGRVGRYVAQIARGFGMEVLAYDPFVKAEDAAKDGVHMVAKHEELYATCDIVSLHMPLNPQTKNLIGLELLMSMKPGAMLCNTARAEVVNEEALAEVLEKRKDFKYCADVPPKNAAQLAEKFKERVAFTLVKSGAQTEEANTNCGLAAVREAIDFFEKGDVSCQVNKAK